MLSTQAPACPAPSTPAQLLGRRPVGRREPLIPPGARAAAAGVPLGELGPVAAVARRAVAPHLAADRAAVAPEHAGDRRGSQAPLSEQTHGVPFFVGDLVIRHT